MENTRATGLLQSSNIICRKKPDEGLCFVLQLLKQHKQPELNVCVCVCVRGGGVAVGAGAPPELLDHASCLGLNEL